MKTPAVFAAVAALVVATTSIGLSAQAQSEAQAPAPAAAAAPASVTPAPAAPADAQPAPASSVPAGDAKLTPAEIEQAEDTLKTKCTRCHGAEVFTALHQNKTEWQGVLDAMGPGADLSKEETALALRYLVEFFGPAATP